MTQILNPVLQQSPPIEPNTKTVDFLIHWSWSNPISSSTDLHLLKSIDFYFWCNKVHKYNVDEPTLVLLFHINFECQILESKTYQYKPTTLYLIGL